jgi:hypothetical protein
MGIEPITRPCWISRLRSAVQASATEVLRFAARGATYGNVRQLVQVLARDRFRPEAELETHPWRTVSVSQCSTIQECRLLATSATQGPKREETLRVTRKLPAALTPTGSFSPTQAFLYSKICDMNR